MKKYVSAILALVLSMSMAACSASGSTIQSSAQDSSPETSTSESASADSTSEEGASEGTTEITFWYANDIQDMVDNMVEDFNSTVGEEKGVHVTAEYQGNYVELQQKLQAAAVAKTVPDVTVLEISAISNFAQGNVIAPLDDYIAADSVDMTDFWDGMLYNCKINDQYYSMPFLRSTTIMFLNNTIIEEAGLDPDELKTWDDVVEYSRIIKEKTGKYGLSTCGYNWFFESMMLSQGSSVLNEDETATNMNTDTAKEIISMIKQMKDEGTAHIYTTSEQDKLTMDLMNQNAAIFLNSTAGSSQVRQVAEEQGFDFQANFMPMGTQYGTSAGGCNLAITSAVDDAHKQAAWEFVKWMTEADQTIYSSQQTGYLVTHKSAAEAPEMESWYEEYPEYKVAIDQLQYATGRPVTPSYTEIDLEIDEALDNIWCSDADMDSTLADLESHINGLL